MPGHGLDNPQSERAPRPEGPRAADRKGPGNVSEQTLSLRERNESYSAIARRLGLRRATDAHHAFIRALSSRTGEEQREMVAREQARLDLLESRVRARDAAEPETMERRVRAIEKLRAALP
jgi:hypothetical protein